MTYVIEAQPDPRAGYAVLNPEDERPLLVGLDEAQAEYAALLLNEGALPDDEDLVIHLIVAITRTECADCGKRVFSAERDANLRCGGCAS